MSEWREVTLGKFVRVKHGYAFKGEFFASEGDEIVLTPGNFAIGGGLQFRAGKERYYTGTYPSEFRLSPGDLLVVMTDLKQDAPILGSPAFVPADASVLHNQRLGLVIVTAEKDLDRVFLYYLLLADTTRSQLRATATGSTVRHTAPVRIYDVRVSLPPVDVQRTVGSVLRAIDDLIENNRRRTELLEQIAQAVYREWFVHFRYPGHEDATFVDSPLGPVPEGWEVRPLRAITTLERTSLQPSRFPEEHFDHYSIPAFDSSALPTSDLGTSIKSGKYVVTSSAVLVSKLNPRVERIWLVEPDTARRSIASTEFLVLRPVSGLSLEFVYLLARSASFQERLQQLSAGTSTSHQRAKPDDFMAIDIAVPPTALVTDVTEVVRAQLRMSRMLRSENFRLAAKRDLLLPKLVSGQIDVSRLDLDAVVGSVA